MRSESLAVHAGTYQEKENHPVNSPVFTSTTAFFTHEGECQYPRYYNMPSQEVVVKKLAALENTETGMLYSSGMAAIAAMLGGVFAPGDHIIFQKDLYGGTYHFIITELPKWGIEFSFAEPDISSFKAVLQPNTKGLYIETPSNPLLRIVDLEAVGAFSAENSLISMIDNTFASPVNQNPAKYGFNLIMHSGTKYLGGHSDLIFGAVLGSEQLIKNLKSHAVNFGPCVNGATCGLIERSLKTLFVRVERQNSNALWLAEQLQEVSGVKKVYYPGLSNHPGHEIARKQMSGFTGMLSFELSGGESSVIPFMKKLKLITPAVSLGGVESLISSPVYTSHIKIGKEGRERMGISESLIRMSVGIENREDLLEDIRRAVG